MKKLLFALILAAGMLVPAISQDKATKAIWDHGDNVSNLTYQNYVISRIYESIDAYTVLYEEAGYEIGKVSIPKSWVKHGGNHKLFFRNRVKTLDNMMTVYYKDGAFYKVILTVSNNKSDDVWAVAPNGFDAGVSQEATTIEVAF